MTSASVSPDHEAAAVPAARPSAPPPVADAPPPQPAAAPSNGRRVDWLTKELGRRPTWEERMERVREAAERLGYPKGPPSPPVRRRTPEEHAAMVAQTDRIRAAIRKSMGPWRFNSTKFIRDMRDGRVQEDDSAYWWKVDDDAGA